MELPWLVQLTTPNCSLLPGATVATITQNIRVNEYRACYNLTSITIANDAEALK